MNTKVEKRFKDESPRDTTSQNVFGLPRKPWQSHGMSRHCPNCGSTELRKVPLVYEQGLSHTLAKSRLRGFVLGDILIGRAITHATHESQLSVRLRPPAKWSYGRVIRWSTLASFAFLTAYIHRVMGTSTPVSSTGAVVGMFFISGVAIFCLFLVWRHNSFSYQCKLGRWSRSFLCQRCGSVHDSVHE